MSPQSIAHDPSLEPLLNVDEARVALGGVSRNTVWRLADAGRLPRVRVSARLVRFRASDIEALIRPEQAESPLATGSQTEVSPELAAGHDGG